MRFLLVAISILFSVIFFLFYTASLGKNIFLISNNNFFFGESIFGQLGIVPLIFLSLAIFYYIYFRPQYVKSGPVHFEDNEQIKTSNNISNLILIIIFILLLIGVLLTYFNIEIFHIYIYYFSGILIYFIFNELFFKKIISTKIFLIGNIYSIISAYIASIGGIIYNVFIEENILLLSTLLIIGFYHVYIHVKYENFISLIFGIITFIYALYRGIIVLFPGII